MSGNGFSVAEPHPGGFKVGRYIRFRPSDVRAYRDQEVRPALHVAEVAGDQGWGG